MALPVGWKPMKPERRFRLSDEPDDQLEISPTEVRGIRRALALVLISLFAGMQYLLWLQRPRNFLQDGPTPVLGPLYFLANFDTGDDLTGYLLLAVMVSCI